MKACNVHAGIVFWSQNKYSKYGEISHELILITSICQEWIQKIPKRVAGTHLPAIIIELFTFLRSL